MHGYKPSRMNHYNRYLNDIQGLIGNEVTTGGMLDFVCRSIFGTKFHGVYAQDLIPKKLSKARPYCIANLDTSDQSGSHWVAIARVGGNRSQGQYMVYDSFGRDHTTILTSLRLKNVINTDPDSEQHPLQMDCGQRCIAWLLVLHYYGADVARTI